MADNIRSHLRKVAHKLDRWEALEALPSAIRAELWEGTVPWSPQWALKHFKRNRKAFGDADAIQITIAALRNGTIEEIASTPLWGDFGTSPNVVAKATLQLSNLTPPLTRS